MIEQLRAIQERADVATEGPWRALGTGRAGGDHWYVCDDGQSVASVASNDGENEDQRQPDAEFIAQAREDVPKLVAALDTILRETEQQPVAHERIYQIIAEALA